MSELKIFVSSTCYDLSQIRADLHDFIVKMGHLPLLSDFKSFPIDPDADTLENCLSNVNTCDVFVLIVGARYGYVPGDGKSITNSEFLHAKRLGVPVFIFISKTIINILPVWKQNKNADFSGIVDSVQVFEFVEELREKNKNWCYEFEKAQDIVPILKIQLSNLFKKSLDLRRKYQILDEPKFYDKLSTKALDILLKKGELYEALFFAQALKDELEKHEHLKLDLEYKILTACSGSISDPQSLVDWLGVNFDSVEQLLESMNRLYQNAYAKYYGEPGEASDIKGLYYVACSIARVFKEMIGWSIVVRSTLVDDEFLLVRDSLANFILNSIDEIWVYGMSLRTKLDEAIMSYNATGEGGTIAIGLKLTANDEACNIFMSEMSRIRSELTRYS